MTTQESMREAFAEAVAGAGGQSAFARLISSPSRPVSQQLISHWLRKGKLPAELVLRVELLTGVSRERLRPDVFCTPTDVAASVA